jgi:hypothetical protein
MSIPKFFLFLLLTSGVLIVSNWQVQAGTQKISSDESASGPSSGKQIEVVFRVSLDELAKKLPTKLALYRCVPDEAGAAQRGALLQSFLGKGAHIELQEASGGVFAGDMDRLWAKAPNFTDEIKDPDEKHILTTAENFLAKIKGQPGEQQTVRRVTH